MRLIEADHPMFARPVVRWLTAVLPLIWAGLELAAGNTGWAVMFGLAGAVAVYELIIVGPSGK